jgi:hypothetical protein
MITSGIIRGPATMMLTKMFKKKENLVTGWLRIVADFVQLIEDLQVDQLGVLGEPVQHAADRDLVKELVQRSEAERKEHLEVDLARTLE